MSELLINYTRGYVVLYEEGCNSWILLPAENLWDPIVRSFLYFLGLFWCFAGISIAADIFMAAIEVIASQERTITRNGEIIKVKIWNGTVANLSLMALGCSAPEILLTLIETITSLGKPAGELGSGAIVGSAAYNMLIVTAVCILAVPKDQSRRLQRFGVFLVTTFFSILAYLWLYIVLAVMTPNEITLFEALVTLMLFPLLVVVSYCQDVNWFRRVSNEQDLESNVLEISVDTTKGEHYEANRAEIASLVRRIRSKDFDPEQDHNTNNFRKSDDDDLLYRMTAVQGIAGRRRTLAVRMNTFAEDVFNNNNEEEEMEEIGGRFAFAAPTYSVRSSSGTVVLKVFRTGMFKGEATLDFCTEDGTAEKSKHYIQTSGKLWFGEGESSNNIPVSILGGVQEDASFFVVISNPSDGSFIKKDRAVVTIVDVETQCVIQFEKLHYRVMESGKFVELTVIREHGIDLSCSAEFETADGTAKMKSDYVETKGTIIFESGETSKVISIPIIDDDIPEDDLSFYVHLKNPSKTSLIGKRCTATVTVVDDDRANFEVEKVADIMKSNTGVFLIDTKSWKQQFMNAMMLSGEMDEAGTPIPPSFSNMFFHFVTFPWKVLFAFIPPPELMGGWPAFFCGLVAIGSVTAVVAQLAQLFGCILGLKDTVTAISFLAVGTSLPDTFASKQAAQESETADTSIGNITGSNSVNVYLGLGLPWTVAALYYTSKGERFVVPSEDLGFSVIVFLCSAVFCMALLLVRRYHPGIGGELGGSRTWKYSSAMMLGGAWLMYLLLSGLRASGHI